MKKIQWGTVVFLIIYLMVLAYVCFWSEGYGRTEVQNTYRYNLVPFKEIMRFYTYRELVGIEAFLLNLFGNVLAFIPFGVMVPIVSRKNRRFFRVLGLTFLLSLFIECIQLIFKVGSFDVDDLILNTVGGYHWLHSVLADESDKEAVVCQIKYTVLRRLKSGGQSRESTHLPWELYLLPCCFSLLELAFIKMAQ